MQKQLVATLKIANTDALTKVKNVAAYMDMVATLNNEIRGGYRNMQFALVMSDINGLKTINDSFGHEMGNLYIRNACRLLCEIFSRSPVYRIGGDEFVVVLQGEDYETRREKMNILSCRISESEKITEFKDGATSLAIGMAEYDPKKDLDVSDVQNRADAMMYEDKRNRKGVLNNAD